MTSCGCVVCLDSPGQKKTVKNKLKILSRWFFLQRHLLCPLKTRNYTSSWNKRLFHFCQKKFFRGGVSGLVNVSWWCRLGVTAGTSFLSSRDVWLFSSNKRKYKTFGILSVHDTNARPSRKEKCRPAQFHPNSCDIFYLLSFLYPVTTFKYGERNTAKKKTNFIVKILKYRSWNGVLDTEQQSTDLITDSFHYTYSLFIMQPLDDSAQLETVAGKRCECRILKQMR